MSQTVMIFMHFFRSRVFKCRKETLVKKIYVYKYIVVESNTNSFDEKKSMRL